jgi:hypothetical protein
VQPDGGQVIRVDNAGSPTESLRCSECGAQVQMTRTDPKRWPWVYKHVLCEKAPPAKAGRER